MYIAKQGNSVIIARETLDELIQDIGAYVIVEQTDVDYQLYNGEYHTPEEIQALETERVNNLSMTPLDFIKALEHIGLTLEQINNFLDDNLEIKTQLTYCNNVYCGVVKSFLPKTINGIEITSEMVEEIFKQKNGN